MRILTGPLSNVEDYEFLRGLWPEWFPGEHLRRYRVKVHFQKRETLKMLDEVTGNQWQSQDPVMKNPLKTLSSYT